MLSIDPKGSTDHMFLRRCLNTEVFNKAAMDKTLHLFFHKTTYKDRHVNNEVVTIRMTEGSLYLKCLGVRFNSTKSHCGWVSAVFCHRRTKHHPAPACDAQLASPWTALGQCWRLKSFCTVRLKPVIHTRLKRCLYHFKYNWQQRCLAIKAN